MGFNVIPNSLSPAPKHAEEQGNGVTVSPSLDVPAAVLPSAGELLPLLQHGQPPMGDSTP